MSAGSVVLINLLLTLTVAVYKYFATIEVAYLSWSTKMDSRQSSAGICSEYYIPYRSSIGSLIYLLSTRLDLSFAVHELAKFSANPGKVNFEGLIHF